LIWNYPCSELRILGELDVDGVIVGEGKESTVELLRNEILEDISGIVFRNDGEIVRTESKPAKLERPMPLIPEDIRDQSIRGANAYIETHRGCIGACGFCQVPKFFGTKVRSPEIVDIIADIKEFKQRGVPRIAISGGTSSLYQYGKSVNVGAFIELLQAIAEVMGGRDVSVPDIRVDYVNERMLHAIHDFTMGWIYYGIESGSFIVGYPGETGKDYQLTTDLIGDTFQDDIFIRIAEPIPETHFADLELHAHMCMSTPSLLTDQLYKTCLDDARRQGGDVRAVTRLLQKHRRR